MDVPVFESSPRSEGAPLHVLPEMIELSMRTLPLIARPAPCAHPCDPGAAAAHGRGVVVGDAGALQSQLATRIHAAAAAVGGRSVGMDDRTRHGDVVPPERAAAFAGGLDRTGPADDAVVHLHLEQVEATLRIDAAAECAGCDVAAPRDGEAAEDQVGV